MVSFLTESREQADRLDRLRGERERGDRLGLRVEQRHSCCRRREIDGQQSAENGRGADGGPADIPHDRSRYDSEKERGGEEAEPRSESLLEMLRDERGVNAGADCAGDDEKLSLHVVAVCDAATLLLTA
jgi:hypothetical protein